MKAWSAWVGVLGVVAVAGANLQIDFPATKLGTGPYNSVSRISADAVLQLDGVDQPGRLAANVVFQGGIPPSVSLVWAYDSVFEGLMDQGTSVTLRDLQVHLTCQEGFPRLSYERGATAVYTYQTGVPFPLNLPPGMPVFGTLECLSPPQCSVSALRLDFGTTGPGQPVVRHLTVANTGGGVLAGEAVADCAAYTVQNGAFALGPGEQHTLTVTLLSALPGGHVCSLDVGGECGVVELAGEVMTPPACMVSVSQLDFGTTQVGLPVTRSFELTNSGLGALAGEVLSGCAAFQVANGVYDLAPGESRTVLVTLVADQPGSFVCELDTGGPCPNLPMLGSVTVAPACQLSATSLEFGSVAPGVVVNRSFLITNTGGGVLSGQVTEACAPFSVSNGSYNLGAGQSQQVTVSFLSSTGGTHTCMLQVGTCGELTAEAEVRTPPACMVSVSQLDFGTTSVGLPVTRTFTLANSGLEVLAGEVQPGCEAFQVANGVYYLAPGEGQLVAVTLLAGEPGVFQCGLDTGGPCPDVALAGTVALAPACHLSADTLDFGLVAPGVPVIRSFTITNVGGGTLAGAVGESCPRFSVGNGSYSLGPGQSRTVTVSFLASELGPHSCALQVGGCGEVFATAQVEPAPTCHLSTHFLDFGFPQPGVPVTRSFLVTNTGGGLLTGAVAPACGDFLVSNGSYSLAAQESQLVMVTLLPESSEPVSCQLDTGANCGGVHLQAGSPENLGEVWGECFCRPMDYENPNYMEFPPLGDPSVLTPYHIMRMTGASGHDSYLQTPGSFHLEWMELEVVVSLAVSECAEALGIYLTPQPLNAVPGQPVLPTGLSLLLDRNAMGAQLDLFNDGLQVATASLPIHDSGFHMLRVRYDEANQLVRVDLFESFTSLEVLAATPAQVPGNAYLGFGGFGAQGCYQYLDDICVRVVDEMGFEVDAPEEGPLEFALEPAAPNPFNPATTLRFTLADPGPVRLKVFNLAGQQVAVLVDGPRERGRHEVRFDAAALASGVYFATLEAEGFCETRRLTLVK